MQTANAPGSVLDSARDEVFAVYIDTIAQIDDARLRLYSATQPDERRAAHSRHETALRRLRVIESLIFGPVPAEN